MGKKLMLIISAALSVIILSGCASMRVKKEQGVLSQVIDACIEASPNFNFDCIYHCLRAAEQNEIEVSPAIGRYVALRKKHGLKTETMKMEEVAELLRMLKIQLRDIETGRIKNDAMALCQKIAEKNIQQDKTASFYKTMAKCEEDSEEFVKSMHLEELKIDIKNLEILLDLEELNTAIKRIEILLQ